MAVEIGIIGGTGFYRFFDHADDMPVETPYGNPSAPISVGSIDDRKVAFVPRHGLNHQYLPSEVPYLANLWALRSLGARSIIGFNTVGSLQSEIRRADFVFCDQFVNWTSGRRDSIFSGLNGAHISSADPYCHRMRAAAIEATKPLPYRFHPTGTVVVIQGPRFSTRAESKWFSHMGWHLVNMTQYPEVVIARELELCYLNVSYVTDYDVAAKEVAIAEMAESVSHTMVIREFALNQPRIAEVVQVVVKSVPIGHDCRCRTALVDARVAR